jgi:predicted NBD/HSP70 family sugar kinase
MKAPRNSRTTGIRNRETVIHLLQRAGRLSQRQLAELSRLHPSTLCLMTAELERMGIVQRVGKRRTQSPGRNQELLAINPSLGWSVGFEVAPGAITMAVLDAGGGQLGFEEHTGPMGLEQSLQSLRDLVDTWKRRRGAPPGALLGAGVGIGGLVDSESGILLFSHVFHAKDFGVRTAVQNTLGVPVFVDNDARLLATAEHHLNPKCGPRFFHFLLRTEQGRDNTYRIALGASMIADGRPLRGDHNAAGELGRTFYDYRPHGLTRHDLDLLASPAAELSEACRETARCLGRCLSPVIDLLDVRVVVLGGNHPWKNRRFRQAVSTAALGRSVHVPDRTVSVIPSVLSDEGVALGAAHMALESGHLLECAARPGSALPTSA